MSIIGRKLGNAKKHNEQILEHNRLKPIPGLANAQRKTLSHPSFGQYC